MKIISDFKDYYDCMSKYENDNKIVFIRKTQKIKEKRRITIDTWFKYYLLLFCGNIYRFCKFHNNSYTGDIYLYDLDSILEHYQTNSYYTNNRRYHISNIKIFYQTDFNHLLSLHYTFKSPIILLDNEETIINPRINLIGFQKIKPTEQAYQEIEQFLSNQLSDNNDNKALEAQKNIDNKTMAEIKGFDDFSFRKTKQSK